MIWQRKSIAHIALTISALTALLGIAMTLGGVVRILESTPVLGILVDQKGNPLPVEGYTQCLTGIALTLTSMPIAILSRAFARQTMSRHD